MAQTPMTPLAIALRTLRAASAAAIDAGATQTQAVINFETGMVEGLERRADRDEAAAAFDNAAAHFDQADQAA